MTMKKAQIQSHFILYIFGIIIICFLLVTAIVAVKNFSKSADETKFMVFKESITNEMGSVARKYGAVKKDVLEVPSWSTEVCFVDLDHIPVAGSRITGYPTIDNNWESGVNVNIFIIRRLAEKFIFAENSGKSLIKIRDPPYFVCIPVNNGKLNVRLEGYGGKAVVSGWEVTSRITPPPVFPGVSSCVYNYCNALNINLPCTCGSELADEENPYCCAPSKEVFSVPNAPNCFFCGSTMPPEPQAPNLPSGP